MKNRAWLTFCVISYFLIRLFSFYFPPETSIFNTIVSVAFLLSTLYFLLSTKHTGWLLIAAEILLGGSGNFLSIGPIALRTTLLVSSLVIWKIQKLYAKELFPILKKEKNFLIISLFLIVAVLIGALHGFLNHHSAKAIFSDSIPYLYLFYYFPLKEYLVNTYFKNHLVLLLYTAIIGCALFTLGTFVIYTTHLSILQDSYYHWFRDIAGGKITDLGDNFFRVVLSEHLAIVPLLLYFAFVNKPTALLRYCATGSLFALYAVNLTRAYLLGLIAGLLVITLFKRSWQAVRISFFTLAGIVVVFSFIHVLNSSSHTLGLEFFGLRIGSIITPSTEASSLSRMLLLPMILEKLKVHPLIGTGLGDTIIVYSPVVKQIITTTQFDWGFLEIQAELGIIGSLAWILFIVTIAIQYIKNQNIIEFGILTSLAVATITGPVLFHVLGIIILAVLSAKTRKYALQPSP